MHKGYARTKLVDYIVTELNAGTATGKLSAQVAAYLVESGKVSELGSIMRDAQELRAQKYGLVELTARSAHQLDAAQIAQIETVAAKQYAGTKQVTIHQVHDQSVVGGANLIFPPASLDITIRNKLNQLRAAI